MKEHETIIKCKKKEILNLAYKQGLLFKKLKDSDNFKEMLQETGVSKSKFYFKVKLLKVLEKYPKLKKSSLLLYFINNCMKKIKEVCKESSNKFK